ncbi:SEC-C domain-containing protein [Patescibacteria group bacterium]|nr:SEC-C domain-containing protein [Patescibacteria group bacterium]
MWWKTKPSFFTKEQEHLAINYPSLNFIVDENIIFIRGKLQIAKIAAFDIEIKLPDDYPNSLPEVKELGGKIPIANDRHVNDDGTCCLTVPAKMYQELGKNYSIIDFIDKFVVPFFANQVYYEIHRIWANGDYSHGNRGMLECYKELLRLSSLKQVVECMKITLQTFPKTSKSCPCGSGKKLRDCHLAELINLRVSIPTNLLRQNYKTLMSYVK